MPREKILPKRSHSHDELVASLANEIKTPQAKGTQGAPYILEETIGQGPYIHVLVIWERWQETPPEERGEIILAAYDRSENPTFVRNITAAMGVTYEEARRLRVGPPEIIGEAS